MKSKEGRKGGRGIGEKIWKVDWGMEGLIKMEDIFKYYIEFIML